MATDLFLEMAELPATGSLGTGQLDTRDLLVAGVPISISSKYLYLYLELSGSTKFMTSCSLVEKVQYFRYLTFAIFINLFPTRGFVNSISSSTTCFSVMEELFDGIA